MYSKQLARCLICAAAMSCRLRMIEPDIVYEVVTGTVDRQFLFRPNSHPSNPLLHESCHPDALDPQNDHLPKPSIFNIIGYALARAMELHPVKLHAAEQNINHIHSNISVDIEQLGNISMFYRTAHSIIARQINKLYNREGHVFAGRLRATSCEDDDAAEDKLIYSITNIVKDGLVDRQNGKVFLSSFPQLSKCERLRFWTIDWRRFHKKGGFRVKSHRPKDYIVWKELEFDWLAGYLNWSESKRQTRIRKQIAEKTETIAEELKAEGKSPMTIARLKALDPRSRPKTPRKSTRQPQCHASTKDAATAFQERQRRFIDDYVPASADFRNGNYQRAFPLGSYRPPLMAICTGDTT